MNSFRLSVVAALAIASTLAAKSAFAAAITAGDVLVYRVGNGAAALANTGNAVFIDEYTPTGTLVQSIAMPTADGGGNFGLVASGTATSEGLLTISSDGAYLALSGYRSTFATNVGNTTGATVNRTVGIIPTSTGVPSVTTALTDFSSGNNPRSAATDGTNVWVSGGAGGVRSATIGTVGTSNQLTTLANFRQVNVYGGQLYGSDQSTTGGNTFSLGTVGSGTPTSGAQTFTGLSGFPLLASGTNTYAFYMADLSGAVAGMDTLYVADEGANALRKYSLVAGTWTLNGTIGVDADDYRGVTGYATPSGVQLFATRKGGSSAAGGGELVSLLDNSGYNGAFSGTPTLIASASTGGANNTVFRGVAALAPLSITVTVTPGSSNLGPASPAVSVSVSGGSATLGSLTTSGLGWSTSNLSAGTFSTAQSLNTVSNQSGRLNGTFRGRTSFAVTGATTGNGTYNYTLTDTASAQSTTPGIGTAFGTAQSSTLLTGDKYTGQNSVEGAGGLGRLATLVDSTALAGDSNVSMSWRNRSSLEAYPGTTPPLPTNISSLITDVVKVDLGASSPTAYVVQMSYDPANLGAGQTEAVSFAADHLYIAHMTPEFFNAVDTGDGQAEDRWQNASLDSGSPQIGVLRGYLTSDLATIGSWGVDTDNHVAWAVMPGGVQGQFAVVPEPASLSLLAIGALALMKRRR